MCIYSTQVLNAEDFDQFLKQAIKKSPYLQSSAIEVEQAKQLASKQLRYTNPSFEVGYSKYNSDNGANDNGYNLSISQEIRLSGVSNDKKNLSNAIINNATSTYFTNKSKFIRDISVDFTIYAQEKKLSELGKKSLHIAKTIYDLSKKRYEVGSISRSDTLQAKVSFLEVQVQNKALELKSMESYYSLLKRAGIKKNIKIDTKYDFSLNDSENYTNSPELLNIKTQQEIVKAQTTLEANTIESVSINGSYTKEPDQTVNGISVSIPLAVFNTKSEEKVIAKLENQKTNLLIENKTNLINTEIKKLLQQRISLEDLKNQNEKVLLLKKELLEMFFEKYKISQATILELQNVKNKLISTTSDLIKIKTALNQNTIYLNYLKGELNE